ncbi:YgiW/YdeI family stress tolerance OB fold protein [Bordetella sp. 02P26C-1]|uniref:YgiW/YdeI family stress tolerance OB fold protein n=1 Tax=Bordetella sp. 02P26C-1 TaxID=2683195 RepID=UPI0013533CF3|nr:NirD/YgiW/YdeI family stress tolerance protein [Bordetella sp. 02P26C-1]MVW80904.1 NirD/YgiW/YdeI family stress tolerance protein [Bordetella sp. 02P26C-1]
MIQTARFSRFTRTLLVTSALSCALVAGAQAQGYAGPSSAPASARQGYAGPSSVPVTTVKALTETGHDDQNAVLRGRIVSHDGGDHYTFEDDTGRMKIEIDDKRFPAGVRIDEKTVVELEGELDRDRHGVEFDVDRIRVM